MFHPLDNVVLLVFGARENDVFILVGLIFVEQVSVSLIFEFVLHPLFVKDANIWL